MSVRTRFAPSPTGYLHIGSVRTALYAWLYARHHGGQYLLRVEDTDRQRSTQEAVDAIHESLKWLGLEGDLPPAYQSERYERYAEVIEQMLSEGTAYRCYCSSQDIEQMRADAQAKGLKPRYDGRCRARTEPEAGIASTVRFRNPDEGNVVVDDLIKGRVVFDNAELDDLIIARSDGSPTYNLTVVVDDADMQITHVIRGDDHLNNTPRQINLFQAIGAQVPEFAHLPMIHGSDGAKLSKRHGAVNILEYRDMGFVQEALLNYLLRLGWSHGDQEIFSLDEMIEYFDLDHVSRSASNFDPDKLLWVNHQHIMAMPPSSLAALFGKQLHAAGLDADKGPALELAVTALAERSQTINEMVEQARCYYSDFDTFDEKAARAHLRPVARDALEAVKAQFTALTEWTEDSTQAAVQAVADRLELKLGKLAQPLRVALTGRAASPGIGTTLMLVGRQRTLDRIGRALGYIEAREAGST